MRQPPHNAYPPARFPLTFPEPSPLGPPRFLCGEGVFSLGQLRKGAAVRGVFPAAIFAAFVTLMSFTLVAYASFRGRCGLRGSASLVLLRRRPLCSRFALIVRFLPGPWQVFRD